MSFTTAAIVSIKENRKLSQFRTRYQRYGPPRTSAAQKLGPKQALSQAGEHRVRRQQAGNLIRDLVLLALSIGSSLWLLHLFI